MNKIVHKDLVHFCNANLNRCETEKMRDLRSDNYVEFKFGR